MKLFLLKRELTGYDEYTEKLIRARSQTHARTIANESTGDERKIWLNKNEVSCTVIKINGEPGVITQIFNAG